jgi:putative ABC transport system substrate-binding protein
MRRRDFIQSIVCAATPWPLSAQRSRRALRKLACSGLEPAPCFASSRSFREGLRRSGYVEGQNVAIELSYARTAQQKLADQVAEFVINLKAAKAIGVEIPATLVARADKLNDERT